MHLWRLRVELENERGNLAQVAQALAGTGANIVSLDVHAISASAIADDLVVASAGTVDATAIAAALAALDARLVDVRAADAHELVDRVTRALDTAARIAETGPDPTALGLAISAVVRCDVSYLRPVGDGTLLDEIEARAAADDRPVMDRQQVKRLPAGGEGAWVLAVPTTVGGRPHVAVAVRRSPRFSYTETARIRGLLGVHEAVGAGRSSTREDVTVVPLRDGGEIVLRPLGTDDEQAMVRLHRRCSRETLRRRYLSSMAAPSPALLRLLVDGGSCTAFAATAGTELLGAAHLSHTEDGIAEVAVLVEDAHQRRGIGASLLAACAEEAVARRIRSLTAICLPDNDAFPALIAGCGYRATQHLDDGLRVLTFPLPRPQEAVVADDGAHRLAREARDHRLWWTR